MTETEVLFFALFGGILPAVFWLLFWLKEDGKRPEPRGLIFLTFVVGMIAVIFVFPFQKLTQDLFSESILTTLFLWAFLEEFFKYFAAYVIALRNKAMDEPVDALIYLVTVALGFAALENTLFIIAPLSDGNVLEGIITGNLRFIGATLLHIVTSATIGIFIAFSFYKKATVKRIYTFYGIVVATVLHTFFNLFIIGGNESSIFITFSFLWLTIGILLLFFEKVKTIYPIKNK